MSYAEELEAARRECYEAREAARQRGGSIELIIREVLGAKQRDLAERQEAARRALGAPPTGSSFTRGTAGLPGPRNAFFVSSFRNQSFGK